MGTPPDPCPFNTRDQVRSRFNGLRGLVVGVDKARAIVSVAWGLGNMNAWSRLRPDQKKKIVAQVPAAHLVFEPGSFRHPADIADAPPRKGAW